jgi:hypothetical protein
MTVDSEVTTTSAQFTQILRSVKQLTAREQLTLAKLLLERVLAPTPTGRTNGPRVSLRQPLGLGPGNRWCVNPRATMKHA